MARIEICEGTVAGLRNYAEVTGSTQQLAASHVARFELDGRPVSIEIGRSPMLDEGDRLAVAGIVRRGTLQALAYRNLTNGSAAAAPRHPVAAGALLAIGGVAIASGLALFGGGNTLGAIIAVVGLLFAVGGLRALRTALHIATAVKALPPP